MRNHTVFRKLRGMMMGIGLLTAGVSHAFAAEVVVTPSNMQGWTETETSGGKVDIKTDNPRSGDGSLKFTTQNTNSKATFDKSWNPVSPTNPFGVVTTVGNLTSASYEWYRSSSSTNPLSQAPAMRLMFLNDLNNNGSYDGGAERWGSLVLEPYYDTNTNVATNTWTTANFIDMKLWMRISGPGPGQNLDVAGGFLTLEQWLDPMVTKPAGAYEITDTTLITGMQFGVGSGWTGQFEGYVDNMTLEFSDGESGQTITYNANVTAVPEPGSGALGLSGIGICVMLRRRFQRS